MVQGVGTEVRSELRRPTGFARSPPRAGRACQCSFILPMATPPNMVMYSTGQVPLRLMAYYGAGTPPPPPPAGVDHNV